MASVDIHCIKSVSPNCTVISSSFGDVITISPAKDKNETVVINERTYNSQAIGKVMLLKNNEFNELKRKYVLPNKTHSKLFLCLVFKEEMFKHGRLEEFSFYSFLFFILVDPACRFRVLYLELSGLNWLSFQKVKRHLNVSHPQ